MATYSYYGKGARALWTCKKIHSNKFIRSTIIPSCKPKITNSYKKWTIGAQHMLSPSYNGTFVRTMSTDGR